MKYIIAYKQNVTVILHPVNNTNTSAVLKVISVRFVRDKQNNDKRNKIFFQPIYYSGK